MLFFTNLHLQIYNFTFIIHCKRVETLLGPRNFFQTRDFLSTGRHDVSGAEAAGVPSVL